jgi:hypothetical protein
MIAQVELYHKKSREYYKANFNIPSSGLNVGSMILQTQINGENFAKTGRIRNLGEENEPIFAEIFMSQEDWQKFKSQDKDQIGSISNVQY